MTENIKKTFCNGQEVEYSNGLIYIFIGIDPLDNKKAYCLHPSAICQVQPELNYKRVDKLPLDKLTKCEIQPSKELLGAVSGSYLCDSCGETFTGKKHKIYDENFNEYHGLVKCDKCFTSCLL